MTAIIADPQVRLGTGRRSLTILMPCLNEKDLLPLTFGEIIEAARQHLEDFEIILVNDGSTDETGTVMAELAAANPEVSVVSNPAPTGLASVLRDGLQRARCDYITILPGDYAFNISGIRSMFSGIGAADVIITYRTNQKQARSWLRYVLTRLNNWIMLTFFLVPLRDVHSINSYRVDMLRQVEITAWGMAFQIEILVKLFRANISCLQLPVALNPQKDAVDRSVSLRTLKALAKVIIHLWLDGRRT